MESFVTFVPFVVAWVLSLANVPENERIIGTGYLALAPEEHRR
jgi:hypothetical protein